MHINNLKTLMKKTIMFKEINKELKRINKKIDLKISKGCSYKIEAKKHKELLSKMQQINSTSNSHVIYKKKRRSRFGKSPVRYNLKRGVMARIFKQGFAY